MKKLFLFGLPFLLVIAAFIPRNTMTVSGFVLDDKGSPVFGATVMEKGTKNGTVTDAAGHFSIRVSNEKATLQVSAAGYRIAEVRIKARPQLSITLHVSELGELETESAQKKPAPLNEVVVTGYANSAQYRLLQGKAAGMQINGTRRRDDEIADRRGYHGIVDSTEDFNTEDYDYIRENPFLATDENPLSTFSIDVDPASYSNVRRFLNNGQLPPAGAVRIEEMVNYFHYDYPQPKGSDPFSVNTEISDCPWNNHHKLVLIGLQGKKIPTENLPPSNLVFLIDVSGSMMEENKLPLVKSSMKLLVDQLREEDRVSLVVYAGNAGLVLPPTSGENRETIKKAIDNLEAGGSTAGGAGIRLAYKTARENFLEKGNNRVILCTDGDFNVGVSSDDELERMIEHERKSGVYLTVLGFGMGNYKDNKMEKLADKGNGNHAYIDGPNEAKKVLVNEFGGTLFTIAKDVKLQIEFNPAKTAGYRLIGYENRLLNKEDFNDDQKDAGELGSGHTVTALYEVIPTGVEDTMLKKVDKLRYQQGKDQIVHNGGDELMNIRLRYKEPRTEVSTLIEHPVIDRHLELSATTNNFRFAAAVAEFGMILRQSSFRANSNAVNVLNLASGAKGTDAEGYRAEFIRLVLNAERFVQKDKPAREAGQAIR